METSVTTNGNETQTTSNGVPEEQQGIQLQTTQPADSNDIRMFNRNQRQKKTTQRRLRQALKDVNNQPTLPSFPKFYSIKFTRVNLESANPIAIERDLKKKAGNFADKISKQNRDTLLVKVCSNRQGEKLMTIQEIATYEVVISPHKSLNQSKGTTLSESMSMCTIEELMETLKDQNVTKIERMQRKINGELIPTHRYILTFSTPELPRTIKLADWHHELVDMYIPTPMQCTRCQKLGHTQKWCRKEAPTCARCSQEGHHAQSCSNEPLCVNCGESHRSTNKKCPHYLFKAEVLATQTRLRCTFQDAEDQVKENYREDGKSYSFALRRRRPQETRQPPREENAQQLQEEASHRQDESSQLQREVTEEPEGRASQQPGDNEPSTQATAVEDNPAKIRIAPAANKPEKQLKSPTQVPTYSLAAKKTSTTEPKNLPIPVINSSGNTTIKNITQPANLIPIRPSAISTCRTDSNQMEPIASTSNQAETSLGAIPKTHTNEDDQWKQPKKRKQSRSPKHQQPMDKKLHENKFDIIDSERELDSNFDYEDYAKELYRTKKEKKSSPVYTNNNKRLKTSTNNKNGTNRKGNSKQWL